MPLPFAVSVTVYNSAGEKVRELFVGGAQALPARWIGDAGAVNEADPVRFAFPGWLSDGSQAVVWDGADDAGAQVSDGIYTVVLAARDPFGSVTTLSAAVQHLSVPQGARLSVYNAAGELVAWSQLSATAKASGFSLERPSIASGEKLQARVDTAGGSTLLDIWNGCNAAGEPVDSGVYIVTLEMPSGSGRITESHSVNVLKAPPGASIELHLAPDPWRSGQAAWLLYPAAPGRRVLLRLYSLAGELVGTAADAGGTGRVRLPDTGFAGGIFLVRVTISEPGQAPWTQTLKLARIR